ncbi:hypothetical protein [Streptomyces koyangensis]|uniref:Uncharacterized protein n=1 Tax=Streptomyces koyangensis TaxID=188770 RepID=A0A385D5Y7_9ACTN|nr:hypothetical protein [Streptomyces koyangensis]AXQ53778.1 hypothetical protein D0C37_03585 [Streptomyces koyangensis]
MAAESGKWAEKHTDDIPAKETPVENDPRPETRTAPREAATDAPGVAGAPHHAPADVPPPPPPPGTEPPGSPGAPGAAATGAGRATVKPQPLAGKNTADPAAGRTETAPRPRGGEGTPDVPVFGAGEGERWSGRLQEAVSGFVDRPREAVAEADEVFAELAGRVTEALAEQRRVLRSGWEEPAGEPDTERLRVALQSYREASERLLKL